MHLLGAPPVSSSRHHHHRRRRPAIAAALSVALSLAAGTSGPVHAHSTIIFDEAGEAAPDIGLIGDSTLSGVRWWGKYGDLRHYNFVLDAESCRRTVERSCWSREDYRPDSTLMAMQRLAGRWGDVLVVMSGYNDTGYLFDDAIDAVVAEAQRQAIPHLIWLTLRTADVSYEDPQQRANADGYREDNRMLYEKAAELGGYLQVADWATHTQDRSDWFSADGVHLSPAGVSGLTTFVADSVDAVLAGGSLNPDVVPWATLRPGDAGATVANVQQALLAAGVATVGWADGDYGDLTVAAVAEFQQVHGLDVSGIVDEPTARALGVYGERSTAPAAAVAPPNPPRPPARRPSRRRRRRQIVRRAGCPSSRAPSRRVCWRPRPPGHGSCAATAGDGAPSTARWSTSSRPSPRPTTTSGRASASPDRSSGHVASHVARCRANQSAASPADTSKSST